MFAQTTGEQVRKIKINYGFGCWRCGQSVLQSQARQGVWFAGEQAHCSKECAQKTTEEHVTLGQSQNGGSR